MRTWTLVLLLFFAVRLAGADNYVAIPPERRTSDDLVVGSWNIKWFGRGIPDSRDITTMADIVEEFDVAAIQELTGRHAKASMEALIAALADRGHRYAYRMSSETGYRSNPVSGRADYLERFAFIWNTDRIVRKSGIRFVSSPRINNATFRQVPIYADFKTKGQGFDFRLCTTHTVYNKQLDGVRRAEIIFLKNWLLRQAKGLEQDIVVLGDFNANPPGQPAHFANEIHESDVGYRVLMLESKRAGEVSVRTTIERRPDGDATYKSMPVYDQILVSDDLSEELFDDPVTRRGFDLGVILFDQNPAWLAKGYNDKKTEAVLSDHRPVWFRLNYSALDNDNP